MIKDQNIKITGILIAAGASRRLGQPKQLINFQNQYLINHIIQELIESDLDDLIVVVGSNSELIQSKLDKEVPTVMNDRWAEGMGTSISCGIYEVDSSVDGILIALVDQYHMEADLINELINQFKKDSEKLIVSQYGNEIYGPPALFPSRMFGDLKLLDGDRGAGKLIKKELSNNSSEVEIINFELGHLDIDTPDDLLKLSR